MLELIAEYYDELLAVIGAIVVIASFIVKITPTKKDDAALSKVISFLERFSLLKKPKK